MNYTYRTEFVKFMCRFSYSLITLFFFLNKLIYMKSGLEKKNKLAYLLYAMYMCIAYLICTIWVNHIL